jgi:hypothetical protein
MTLVPKEDLISHLELTPVHKEALELLDTDDDIFKK